MKKRNIVDKVEKWECTSREKRKREDIEEEENTEQGGRKGVEQYCNYKEKAEKKKRKRKENYAKERGKRKWDEKGR